MTDRENIKVREAMTPSPRVIDGLATAREAMDMMRDHGVSSLVIDRRDEGDEYGLVTVHDIASRIIANNRAPERVSVYEIMSKPALAVDAEMDIKYAIRILTRFQLTRALVTEQRSLVGIVTLRDMAIR